MYRVYIIFRASLSLLGAVLLVGCPSSCGGETSSKNVQPVKKMVGEFPAISVEGLGQQQMSAFTNLVNEEICPCECSETFADCLRANTKCRSAQVLGQWIVDEMREGAPVERFLGGLTFEIMSGARGAPQLIETADYLTKGPSQAKVTIVEFADFDCVHCKTTAKLMDEFLKAHSDDVQFVFKYFPLENTPASKLAACAVEAAVLQGKGWEMHEVVFETPSIITRESLIANAQEVGLDVAKFEKDMLSEKIVKKVDRSKSEGLRIGISGTPAIFFNGRPFNLLQFGLKGLEMRLAMELVRDKSSCN